MQLATPFRIGLLLLVSTGAAVGQRAEQKPAKKEQASATYVVVGCGLMSLGLLFGHIRQKPTRRRSR